MKRINDVVKKVILLIVIVTLLLFLNYTMAIGAFGEFINANLKKIVIYALAFVGVVDALMAIYDLICFASYKYSDKICKETRDEVEISLNQNISTSLVFEKENLERQNITEYINYIWTFINDKNAYDILNYLMNEFENNRLSQPDIAFFFLSNQYNNSIIGFFNNFPDFRNKCLSCSKEIVNQVTYDDSLIGFDSHKLRNITNEFMHFCIGNSSVDINEWIDYIRKVLSWICCQAKRKELFSNYELKRFMLIIPRLEQRLLYLGIDDKMIKLYIKKLKKSLCLTKMIYDSNKLLWQLDCDSLVVSTYSVGLLISYPEKFNLLYQFLMQQAVVKKRKLFKEQYHTYHHNAITLLFSIIPLGQINNPNQDIADKILSIINLFGGVK